MNLRKMLVALVIFAVFAAAVSASVLKLQTMLAALQDENGEGIAQTETAA